MLEYLSAICSGRQALLYALVEGIGAHCVTNLLYSGHLPYPYLSLTGRLAHYKFQEDIYPKYGKR